jgi:hypothetical protein
MTKLSVCLPVSLIVAAYLSVGAGVQGMPVVASTSLLSSTGDTGILLAKATSTVKKQKQKCFKIHSGVSSKTVIDCRNV